MPREPVDGSEADRRRGCRQLPATTEPSVLVRSELGPELGQILGVSSFRGTGSRSSVNLECSQKISELS